MGSEIPSRQEPRSTVELVVLALTERPISTLDIVRAGQVIETIQLTGEDTLHRFTRTLRALDAGEYLYVRVIQVDGGAAWSSPFWGG